MSPIAVARPWIVFGVVLSTMLSSLDATIVTIGYPTIAGSLDATLSEISWISTAYILAMTGILPLSGWLAARFGRRKLYLASIALFVVGSMFCGLSTNIAELTIARALQGLAAGTLTASSSAILFQIFTLAERPRAMSYYSIVTILATMLGPTVGGLLLGVGAWPLMFFINLPVGVAAFVTAMLVAPDATERRTAKPIQWGWLATMLLGIVCLQYALQVGQQYDWLDDPRVAMCLAIAGICLPLFVWNQWRSSDPMVRVRLFTNTLFVESNVIICVASLSITATNFIVPLYVQQDLGYTPIAAAILMLPVSAATIVVTRFAAPWLMKVMKESWLVIIALGLAAVGCISMALYGGHASGWTFIWPRMLQISSTGLLFVPLNVMLVKDVPRSEFDDAIGIGLLLKQVCSTIGIALLGTVLARSQTSFLRESLAQVGGYSWQTTFEFRHLTSLLQRAGTLQPATAAQAMLVRHIEIEARHAAFSAVFTFVAYVLIATIVFLIGFQLAPRLVTHYRNRIVGSSGLALLEAAEAE